MKGLKKKEANGNRRYKNNRTIDFDDNGSENSEPRIGLLRKNESMPLLNKNDSKEGLLPSLVTNSRNC